MKISKIISVSLLAVMFASCFVGCKDDADTSSPTNSSTSQTTNSAPYENEGIVKFAQEEVNVYLGDSLALEYDCMPAAAKVEFFSADEGIAVVDETGRITATGIGSVKIWAWMGGGARNSVLVNVIETKTPLYDINMRSNLQISSGEDFILQTTLRYGNEILDSDNLIWTTSNASVATVNNNGVVTAKAYGETKITARYYKNDVLLAEKVCNVKVLEFYDITAQMSVNGEIWLGDSFTLTPTIKDKNGVTISDYSEVVYSSANEEIISCEEGVFTAKAFGTVEVTVSYRGISCDIPVTVSGLTEDMFEFIEGIEGTKVETKINEGFVYTGIRGENAETYVGVKDWQTFVNTAINKGFTTAVIKVYSIEGIISLCPANTDNSLFGNRKGEYIRAADVETNVYESRMELSTCTTWDTTILGTFESGSFTFTISLE